ncbi:non-canonical purine NTP pyrophosphatase [Thermaurantimonas aggregans]|uniref:dITP/XTP pyrophosphatase n=1 Tax=Thermaurantimonas aggregans TaxID=2173829 RepID=A0A401XIQ1_9FLAO|nr:RdgB/HAM1 family non-canonical purine NTP pyrophosphatase [Thermaurantimonas aggregans]GCD76917.1 non-canonical purine NTP pyrophosphatase [Thermaurantimonas aggregans]
MIDIVFASNNAYKLEEIASLLPPSVHIRSMKEAGIEAEIPETGNTLKENAFIKADFLRKKGLNAVLADDTGLEVNSLNGAPGVYSARYAGPEANAKRNMEKLLTELETVTDRTARFVTVLCFVKDGDVHYFEGEVKGIIVDSPRGNQGFGYDPVFLPDGFNKTFAEMTLDEKNSISHRKRALEKFLAFLQKIEQ